MSDLGRDSRWRRGLELLRERAWFEAHEALEDCWRELPPGPQREAAQGVIQAAVALEHLRRGNAIGAEKVWARARARWAALAEWPLEPELATWWRELVPFLACAALAERADAQRQGRPSRPLPPPAEWPAPVAGSA